MTVSSQHLTNRSELEAALRHFFNLSGLSYAATARVMGISISALDTWRKGKKTPKEVHWRMKYKPALIAYLDERDRIRRQRMAFTDS